MKISHGDLRDMFDKILEREEPGEDNETGVRYLDLAEDLGIEWTDMIDHLIEVMDHLEDLGQADFILLRDEKFRQWWLGVKELREADEVSGAAAKKVIDFISSLSSAERLSLGLK